MHIKETQTNSLVTQLRYQHTAPGVEPKSATGHPWRKSQRCAAYLCACLSITSLSSCAIPQEPNYSELPAVADAQSATLKVRSQINTSNVQHSHILYVDGLVADRFKQDDIKSVDSEQFVKFNYNSVDGEGELDLSVKAGEDVCLKITFQALEGCAILEQAKPEFCEVKR